MSLDALPYDLLFNIAQYLAIDDLHNLQATCKSLRTFTLTRPVYRALAQGLLARSRPLPLPAFQRLSDLSTPNLIKAVDKAHSFERAWRIRAPRPARSIFSLSSLPSTSSDRSGQWYTKISAPPNEEIDWLSPITSSYTLCATKSGRVICWDVARDICLAEWDPRTLSSQRNSGVRVSKDGLKMDRHYLREDGGDDDGDAREDVDADKKWELWKCRVEFDERAVYFTMARVLAGSYDDNRVMEFVLMKLAFPPEVRDHPSPFSQSMLFSPESRCYSLPKSAANSPPPSSQGSSPQDSTLHTSCTVADSACSTRSPISTRTTSPLPDCGDGYQDMPTHTPIRCGAPSDCPTYPSCLCVSARGPLRGTIVLDHPAQPINEHKPIFFPLTSFHTTGVVMNVFLLDPPRRLLSAFVWIASSNTIGLYVLLDWAKDEYVFVDTGVGCLISSNWSCILHDDQIVIHSEEADAAYQHFYPLGILRNYTKTRGPSILAIPTHNHDHRPSNYNPQHTFCRDDLPVISTRLSPMKSISKKFVFPAARSNSEELISSEPTSSYTAGDEDASIEARDVSPDSSGRNRTELSTSILPVPSERSEQASDLAGVPDDGSEFSVDDDDDRWSQEAVAESSRSKGKGRADNEAMVEPDEPGPSFRRAKGKGKMRQVDLEQRSSGETSQVQSSPASHQVSPGTHHPPGNAQIPPEPSHATTSTSSSAPNPYPFPPWYPESAHFVRQWWPTLPGVPRLSCTVVLLAAHDPETHRTRFVLAQHYFRVPIVRDSPSHTPTPDAHENAEGDDEMLHLWYVSTPFEVVCVLDGSGDNDDEEEAGDRPRPLVAVDFGHAVWIEYAAEPGGVYGVDASRLVGHAPFSDSDDDGEDEAAALFTPLPRGTSSSPQVSPSASQGRDQERPSHGAGESANPHEGDGTIYDPRRHRVPKCLRFVTFPPVFTAVDPKREKSGEGRLWREAAVVRTLEIPEELDLDGVETINIDQSQGAVILSVKEGKIFILRYE